MSTTVIVDYRMGNTGSVKRKLDKIGAESKISSLPEDVISADRIILPGIGHFHQAVNNLKDMRLWDVLSNEVLTKKKPVLGICLGMQLMAKYSQEGDSCGLGWIDAEVLRFTINNKLKYKVPHIGWNQVSFSKESRLNTGIPELAEFYFVHSYYMKCNDEADILHKTDYESTFTSSIERGNIFGVQFHPEKSHDEGEQLLKNFIALQSNAII